MSIFTTLDSRAQCRSGWTPSTKEAAAATSDSTTTSAKASSPPSSPLPDKEPRTLSMTSLQKRSQIPLHLRFNRYVLDHYRPPTDFNGCLRSLFYLHNETVNIFTHAVPIFAILINLPTILPWKDLRVPLLPWVHVFACVAPWVGSTIYHLFMNHKQGYPMYRMLLMTDMIGIWIAQNMGSLTSICATFYCFCWQSQYSILFAFGLASMFSLYKATNAKCPWQRRYSFLMPFGFRLAVIIVRLLGFGGGHPDSVLHLVLQDVVAIIGAFIGASNIPERWFPPGNLDLINSHAVMHIFVLYAAWQMHVAVHLDLVWMSEITEGRLNCP